MCHLDTYCTKCTTHFFVVICLLIGWRLLDGKGTNVPISLSRLFVLYDDDEDDDGVLCAAERTPVWLRFLDERIPELQ